MLTVFMLRSSPPGRVPFPVELPDFGYLALVIEFFYMNVLYALAPYPIKDFIFCCFLLIYYLYWAELCELPTIILDVLNLLIWLFLVVTLPWFFNGLLPKGVVLEYLPIFEPLNGVFTFAMLSWMSFLTFVVDFPIYYAVSSFIDDLVLKLMRAVFFYKFYSVVLLLRDTLPPVLGLYPCFLGICRPI
jgi:hypothetical protein